MAEFKDMDELKKWIAEKDEEVLAVSDSRGMMPGGHYDLQGGDEKVPAAIFEALFDSKEDMDLYLLCYNLEAFHELDDFDIEQLNNPLHVSMTTDELYDQADGNLAAFYMEDEDIDEFDADRLAELVERYPDVYGDLVEPDIIINPDASSNKWYMHQNPSQPPVPCNPRAIRFDSAVKIEAWYMVQDSKVRDASCDVQGLPGNCYSTNWGYAPYDEVVTLFNSRSEFDLYCMIANSDYAGGDPDGFDFAAYSNRELSEEELDPLASEACTEEEATLFCTFYWDDELDPEDLVIALEKYPGLYSIEDFDDTTIARFAKEQPETYARLTAQHKPPQPASLEEAAKEAREASKALAEKSNPSDSTDENGSNRGAR